MRFALEAAASIATWLTTLFTSVLIVTNDISWYLNASASRPLMTGANCSFPTLACIRRAKTHGLALIEQNDAEYWLKVREDKAQTNEGRRVKETHDKAIADAFSKAERGNEWIRKPLVCSVTVLVHNVFYKRVTRTSE
jgi:hypothetical protein